MRRLRTALFACAAALVLATPSQVVALDVGGLSDMVEKLRETLRGIDKDCFDLQKHKHYAKWFDGFDVRERFVDHWGGGWHTLFRWDPWALYSADRALMMVARQLVSLRGLLLTIRTGNVAFYTYNYDPQEGAVSRWEKGRRSWKRDPGFPERYNDPPDNCGDRVGNWLKMPEWDAVRQLYPEHYVPVDPLVRVDPTYAPPIIRLHFAPAVDIAAPRAVKDLHRLRYARETQEVVRYHKGMTGFEPTVLHYVIAGIAGAAVLLAVGPVVAVVAAGPALAPASAALVIFLFSEDVADAVVESIRAGDVKTQAQLISRFGPPVEVFAAH